MLGHACAALCPYIRSPLIRTERITCAQAARPARSLTLFLKPLRFPWVQSTEKHIDTPLDVFVDVSVCAACHPSLQN